MKELVVCPLVHVDATRRHSLGETPSKDPKSVSTWASIFSLPELEEMLLKSYRVFFYGSLDKLRHIFNLESLLPRAIQASYVWVWLLLIVHLYTDGRLSDAHKHPCLLVSTFCQVLSQLDYNLLQTKQHSQAASRFLALEASLEKFLSCEV